MTAGAAVLLYHAANAQRLASAGRHLGAAAGAAIVAVPYLVGSLVLLESHDLLPTLVRDVTAGLLAAWPQTMDTLGRVLLVVAFNEAIAQGISRLTKGAWLRSLRAHMCLVAAAVAVVAAPQIAALGAGVTVAGWSTTPRLLAMLAATLLSQAGLWGEVYLITGLVMDGIHGQAPSQASALAHPWQGMKKGMIYSGVFLGILYGLDLLGSTPGLATWAVGRPLVAGMLFGRGHVSPG